MLAEVRDGTVDASIAFRTAFDPSLAICIMPNHVLQSLCKNISFESYNKYVFNTLHVLAYQKVNQLISCCENRLLFYFNHAVFRAVPTPKFESAVPRGTFGNEMKK